MKTIHFISGLPRSGSTLIANVLKQNPEVHAEAVSSLSSIFSNIHVNWIEFKQNLEYPNDTAKKNVLSAVLKGYYQHIEKPIVLDKDRGWILLLPILESVLQRQVKIIVCVRNPAEILSSYEKLRRENPLFVSFVDKETDFTSSIASRAYYFAGPDGHLGSAHRHIKDVITMGYLDRLLFVDYNKYCSTPKSQTKRIYEFLELPNFDHNFKNIQQEEKYNDLAVGLPNLHKIKTEIDKTTTNCVEYLGLELYEQYNREIFWNAWI